MRTLDTVSGSPFWRFFCGTAGRSSPPAICWAASSRCSKTKHGWSSYAARIIDEGQNATVESRNVLAAMNASPYRDVFGRGDQLLSEADLRFGNILKAAGRMQQGHIQCSTSFGRAAHEASKQYQPDILQRDGTLMYRNLAPFGARGEPVVAVQLERFVYCLQPIQHQTAGGTNHALHGHRPGCADQQGGATFGRVATTAGHFL